MDWIKKNPTQLALGIVALLVLAVSFLLYQKTSGFPENFSSSRVTTPMKKEIPTLDMSNIEEAGKSLTTPVSWTPAETAGLLFVSKKYVHKGDILVNPKGSMFNPPVPNDWLEKYHLDPLNVNVLAEDPDKDGFSNMLEYLGNDAKDGGNDSTDPLDAASHPPYHTRLRLARIVNIPFRLIMKSYDTNPKNPKEITVQLNTVDAGNKTMYVEVGLDIPNTKFKTVSFVKKEVPSAAGDGTTKDISELTVMNKETGVPLVLPIGEMRNSPESYVVLAYDWVATNGTKTADMNLKKGQTFVIPPENTKTYKVIDIGEDSVEIETPSGVKIKLHLSK